ncbi:MAG: hypothetical protein A3B74_04790 [Candidatus Kerfeldbacteria bacterium RIFCSPHIGHO2_02_FULL_42_14]|uniref:tRNA-dihydrouridine synthase n=1 Tax=Candidatus Kerfeldbacteria bacterium RIFCSPHIGHO2_02_FULL_42_14 TaxID=1798540 RepID=A0A1G2AP35_9BACT|nr:MAG: hypothetical protein A3B74_04790 [Candidatus Kerfeldbacteria bacterium RIFCSPHIGHO2_02_FULL_42_14]OGY81039.1 MAG: hypothetical protein A3E60_03510 [Candidatus Kerfeldbacteria bacterium RIFCSPHIGHO2_12_FULL_42_13]OGY84856.1 MAG: hypothetical protein A3I91_05155 [Candidatus Kerfeldbacteria bacterium RIFCSPLOWO2_02_FULL_42_19]OGY85659.1 MAG: hypothetical protein A3G01_04795 [Candidatus Kerfeldbacteria bacterium RIFCSPLOWO2_12_FULL_43_9]
MIKGFYTTLRRPFFVLAPLDGVTDAVFRRIIAKYGKPDILYTEFTSVDALCSEGRAATLVNLKYSEKERPIVAQIFGSKPELFYKTAKLLCKLGFDGIDINMGCPEKTIVKSGSCAALIQKPKLAQKIIRATQEGASKIPVSVKTRIGFNEDETDTWIPALLATKPAAITIHGRTRKEMSKVPTHWDVIEKAVKIRDRLDSKTLIIGNGDVATLEDAKMKAKQYHVDGVMLGRAIFGNPWLFDERKKHVTQQERIKVFIEHAKLYERLFCKTKPFMLMKKHCKAYISGWPGAKILRKKLMETNSVQEMQKVIDS